MNNKASILFIEDDMTLGYCISSSLEAKGYEVHFQNSFDGIANSLAEICPDVIILDIIVGNKNGIEFIPRLKDVMPDVPIIIASSHTDISIMDKAFKAGAADFVKKPYDAEELAVFIEKDITFKKVIPHSIRISSFLLNTQTHILSNNSGWNKKLSNLEYKFLKLLSNHADNVVSIDDIKHSLWITSCESAEYAVRNLAGKLRQLLSSDDKIEIHTINGVGYKLILKK